MTQNRIGFGKRKVPLTFEDMVQVRLRQSGKLRQGALCNLPTSDTATHLFQQAFH